MRLFFTSLIYLVFFFFNSGCASYFTRKSCESINWFEHGQSVALRGQWLNTDATLNSCRKAEADIGESELDRGFKSGVQIYCSNERAYLTGKSGDLFSRDICDGPQLQVLLSEHSRGLKDYCSPANSVSAGTSGKKYQNVCPLELEKGFLPGYQKGRKKYIQTVIENKSEEIRSLDGELMTRKNESSISKSKLFHLEAQKNFLEAQKSTALANGNTSLANHVDFQIRTVEGDLNSARNITNNTDLKIRNLESKIETLKREIADFKIEITSLEP